MIYDSAAFPEDLRKMIYDYIRTDLIDEKKAKDTDEQFIYTTRKKGFGPYKKQMWELPAELRRAISDSLEEKIRFLFSKLEVIGTAEIVQKYIKPVDVPLGDLGAEPGETKPLEEYGEGE